MNGSNWQSKCRKARYTIMLTDWRQLRLLVMSRQFEYSLRLLLHKAYVEVEILSMGVIDGKKRSVLL